jgi:Rrf2 family protein
MNTVFWLGFPKRLLSALKGLCCLAQSQRVMQAPEIARRIGVSDSETGKVMQLLVWGGFVTSRRGSKGGFQLATTPDQITTDDVVRFFFSKYQDQSDLDCPIVHVLRTYSAPCQEAFGRLTLADIAAQRSKSLLAVAEKEDLKHEAV